MYMHHSSLESGIFAALEIIASMG
jgi:hypothetical protein